MYLRFLIPVILWSVCTMAQQKPELNIVPNPGFEDYSAVPDDWFYTGDDFSRVMRYWESPTGASPDVYGPEVYVPKHWRDKGFGQSRARQGQSMVGITLYGCKGGKPHCREYIQTQLIEQLVPGQRYELSYWVRHLPNSLQVNSLGAAFTHEPVGIRTDEMLTPEFTVSNADILSCAPNQWLQCVHEFHAASDEGYMIIGNFHNDAETRVRSRCPGDCLPFAYYYIDDVILKKLPPLLEVPIAPDDLTNAILEPGKTIRLNYIFFESGRADFLPRSFRELNILLGIMHDNPEMIIEVHGHTDSLGSYEYNQQLSIRRAQNVVDYLISHGIESDRLRYAGFGDTLPVADNGTEAGRSRNRRVEFFIVSL